MLTLNFKDTYINNWFSIGGVLEKNSFIKNANLYMKDYYYGCKTFEDAEIKMIQTVFKNLEAKNKIDLIMGGNLSNQLALFNYAFKNTNKPLIGLYSACATFIEGAIMASNLVEKKKSICVLTSSHEHTAERQFRYPIEYESLKKCYSTVTITACVGAIISKTKSNYKIVAGTIGEVIDYDITDVFNMGAVMASSAAQAIDKHIRNRESSIKDYDLILTGDLGSVGLEILNKTLKSEYNLVSDKIYDAGSMIYTNNQFPFAGGSGPAVLPFVFFNKYIQDKKLKRILLVGTGALHSKTTVNQHKSIPSIAHVLEIEVSYD